MRTEELVGKYEINRLDSHNFHQDLVLYYDVSKQSPLSVQTEKKWLDNLQIKICNEYEISYPTFLKNLELLVKYNELTGGRC